MLTKFGPLNKRLLMLNLESPIARDEMLGIDIYKTKYKTKLKTIKLIQEDVIIEKIPTLVPQIPSNFKHPFEAGNMHLP